MGRILLLGGDVSQPCGPVDQARLGQPVINRDAASSSQSGPPAFLFLCSCLWSRAIVKSGEALTLHGAWRGRDYMSHL
jgi:hypothetical protein